MVFHTLKARARNENFLRRRREVFERFKAKRQEAAQIRQTRASIKRQSAIGRTQQKIGVEKGRLGGKLKIAREKAEVRKQQMELKRLKFERFRESRTGRFAAFTASGIRAARRSKPLRGTVLASRRRKRIPIPQKRRPRRRQRDIFDLGGGLSFN